MCDVGVKHPCGGIGQCVEPEKVLTASLGSVRLFYMAQRLRKDARKDAFMPTSPHRAGAGDVLENVAVRSRRDKSGLVVVCTTPRTTATNVGVQPQGNCCGMSPRRISVRRKQGLSRRPWAIVRRKTRTRWFRENADLGRLDP